MDKLEKALEKARLARGASALPPSPFGVGTKGARAVEPPVNHAIPDYISAATPVMVEEQHLETSRILAHHARSAEADVFRILRTHVLQVMSKSNFRSLAITSPRYGDGKTTISLNLALSIALDLKQTVLLADLDVRKPNLHEFLGIKPKVGLTDYLTGKADLSTCLTRLSFERLSILPAGTAIDHSSELLGSPKMAALASELKSRYPDRIVIYDMPPVLNQDDSIAFLPHVDATLVVIRDGHTRADELKTCMAHLTNVNVIGTVLNNSRS